VKSKNYEVPRDVILAPSAEHTTAVATEFNFFLESDSSRETREIEPAPHT
jgi:hypothetical protein